MKKQRATRKRFIFWLNTEKEDEVELIFFLKKMKGDRKFTAIIRDGLRLMMDLRSGHTDVLVEMFPDIGMAFHPAHLQKEIDRLAQLIQERPAAPANFSGDVAAPNKIYFPDLDVSLNVSMEKGTGNSAENFVNGMLDWIS